MVAQTDDDAGTGSTDPASSRQPGTGPHDRSSEGHKMRLGTKAIATLFLGVALAGCTGGAGGEGSPAAPTPGPTAGQPTDPGPQLTPEPGAGDTPAPQPTQGGGGQAAGVCELVTEDELTTLFGKPVVLQVLPGVGGADTCDVQANDAPIAAFVYMPPAGTNSFVFDAWASDPSAEDVAGIGDRAIYVGAQELFVVTKSTAIFSVAVYDVDITDADRVELMRQIGALAAARM